MSDGTEMTKEPTNDDIISYDAQILGILNRIRDAHLLLTATIPQEKSFYSTALIDVLPEQHSLILDELLPREGHEKLTTGSTLNIHTRLKGVDTEFSVEVTKIEHGNGIASYFVGIPQHIAYYQKRQQFRASARMFHEIYIELETQPNKFVMAQIADISLTGIGLYCDPAITTTLAVGQQFSDVHITLPDCKPFYAELEIRTIRKDKQEQTLIVGTRFRNLHQSEERQVQRYVAMLDRQTRQKRRI